MESGKHPFENQDVKPFENKPATNQTAGWWSDHTITGWDRVKEAFHRDWEQTKADFSKKSGHALNQDADDTIKQATGAQVVPPIGQKTKPGTRKDARKAQDKMFDASKKAAKKVASAEDDIDAQHAKLIEKTNDIHEDLGKQKAKANERIADATRAANENMDKARIKIDEAITDREDAQQDWLEAEREASYGFAARTHYPQFTEWSPELETALRGDWARLNTGKTWDDARVGVRRGWDFSKPQIH